MYFDHILLICYGFYGHALTTLVLVFASTWSCALMTAPAYFLAPPSYRSVLLINNAELLVGCARNASLSSLIVLA